MASARLQPYVGQWVLRSSGENLVVLQTSRRRGAIVGTLTAPLHLTEGSDGVFSGITQPLVSKQVSVSWGKTIVFITVGRKPDREKFTMVLQDTNHLVLNRFQNLVPPWKFERVESGEKATVALDWPIWDSDPKVVTIREQLRVLAEKDQAAREKEPIDPVETEELSRSARPALELIYQQFGWPKYSVFGTVAVHDFWVLIQHQSLDLQQQMLDACKRAVVIGETSERDYAYLFDRIQVSEGKLQHWGTQSKCQNGRAVLYQVDDMSHLEQRRKTIKLDSITGSLQKSDDICRRLQNAPSGSDGATGVE
jgi:hypothetical protein